ncbi:MAG: hypothetical protein Rubg2KO_25860 [Rubricoccaceae bacterium]
MERARDVDETDAQPAHLAAHIRVRADGDSLKPALRWDLNGAARNEKSLGIGAAYAEATDGDTTKARSPNANAADKQTVSSSANTNSDATDSNALEVAADARSKSSQQKPEAIAARTHAEAADHHALHVASGTGSEAPGADAAKVAAATNPKATNRESCHVATCTDAQAAHRDSCDISTGPNAEAADRQPAEVSTRSNAQSTSCNTDEPVTRTNSADRQPDAFDVARARQRQPESDATHLTETVGAVLGAPDRRVEADGTSKRSVAEVEPDAGNSRDIPEAKANLIYADQDSTSWRGVGLCSGGKNNEEKSERDKAHEHT